MVSTKQPLIDRLQALRNVYINNYPERVDEMLELWRKLSQENPDPELLKTLHRHAHSLKGSGATYGFRELGDLAGQLDAILSNLTTSGTLANPHENEQISILLDKLKDIQLSAKDQFDMVNTHAKLIKSENKNQNQSLLLVSNNPTITGELSRQLSFYGFKPTTLTSTGALIDEVHKKNPAAIIIDVEFGSGEHNGIRAIRNLSYEADFSLPYIIFISKNDDIKTRIEAANAGCNDFFCEPVNITALIDRLDSALNSKQEEPFRIMIVEDTRSLAHFYELTLQNAGMTTRIVTDPLEVIKGITDFSPELILMDMYMPDCNGMELAKVIRQYQEYVSIPIVFLSSEMNADKQLEAMQQGGDDFLTKPIDPRHLVLSVEMRSLRYRKLRSLMVRDSLTGLYNHTKTKELLEQDIYRTERNKGNLTFAMIDIDKFKSVNDTYGHPVGDRVIKNLARLLKQRLRKSDTVGRYGGEEFAVIFYDTDIDNARRIMDDLRKTFEKIVHHAGETEFCVTFSCGLAAYPLFQTSTELNEAADKALYKAKESGRNRIEIADLPED